jgi:hypothetical protein
MPTAMMAGLHTNPSIFYENALGPFSPVNQNMALGSANRNTFPAINSTSLMSMRQQMDESNHDMVNMLTQQTVTVLNPLIHNTNNSYQMLATQMGRIADSSH